MENAIEERYVFLRSCHSDFSQAMRILKEAADCEKNEELPNSVSGFLQQYAVVVYFRPFTRADTLFEHLQTDGRVRKKILLDEDFISPDLRPLHDELHAYRDSAYAHSDIAIRNPKLTYWRGSSFEFTVRISPIDKKPLHIHRNSILRLCEAGLERVTTELRTMEEEFRGQHPEKE